MLNYSYFINSRLTNIVKHLHNKNLLHNKSLLDKNLEYE